jgi:hypothetical protein
VVAPPKLLIDARLDVRPADAGLEREFRTLLAIQPQPAGIAYSVPFNSTAPSTSDVNTSVPKDEAYPA